MNFVPPKERQPSILHSGFKMFIQHCTLPKRLNLWLVKCILHHNNALSHSTLCSMIFGKKTNIIIGTFIIIA